MSTPPTKIAATVTTDRISITLDGRFRTFLRTSEQGQKLEIEVKKDPQDLDQIRLIADITAYIAAKTFGRVILDDKDRLRLDGVAVDYIAIQTFKRVLDEGFDITPMVKFIENVDQNPDKSVAADLYKFLEKGNLPITPDGKFHAFKRVGQDLFDLHSHTVEYALGSTVSMPRENCDPNRHQTCSRGLHACSFDYLSAFHGGNGRILIVEIDPKDVTAIPTDYNQAKLRCCKMVVLGEIPEEDARAHFTSAVDKRYTAQVDPEDATDATAADGVDVTATAPEATVEVAIDWAARGYAAGKLAGSNDGENEYDFDAQFDMPYDLNDGPDSARQAYTEAYVRGYSEGFSDAKDGGDLDAGAIDEELVLDDNGFPRHDEEKGVEFAALWGKEDAEADIARAIADAQTFFRLDHYDGARRRDVSDSQLYYDTDSADDDKYDKAYKEAYNGVLYPAWLEQAKKLGAEEGCDWAEGDTDFDASSDNGDSYTAVDNAEDDEGDNPFISAYSQAFVTAYVARFNEQNT